jgi:hypothetical protein
MVNLHIGRLQGSPRGASPTKEDKATLRGCGTFLSCVGRGQQSGGTAPGTAHTTAKQRPNLVVAVVKGKDEPFVKVGGHSSGWLAASAHWLFCASRQIERARR